MNKFCYYAFGINNYLFLFGYSFLVLVFIKPLRNLISNKYFQIFLIFLIPTLIFIKEFRNDPFFYGDDLAMLGVVYKSSYMDLIRVTLHGVGIWVGHRYVLGLFLLKTIYDFFGANINPYIFIVYLFNAISTLLFYFLSKKLFKENFISLFVSIIFSSFYLWTISTIYELMAGTFILLVLLFWLKWLSGKKRKWLVISSICYVLAMFSKEIAFFLGPAMIALTFSIKNVYLKVDSKKLLWPLTIFLILFILYAVFFASSFYSYFSIKQGVGYSMTLTATTIFSNLVHYTSLLFPFLSNESLLVLPFLISFPVMDILKKKIVYTPFLLSYLLFIGPPLLFNTRVANYYTFIPSIFIYLAFGLFLKDCWGKLVLIVGKKKKNILKYFGFLFASLILLYGFNIKQLLLDNCFLIQYPWMKPYKSAFYSLVKKVNNRFESNQIKNGDLIILKSEEKNPETEEVFYNSAFAAFLTYKRAQKANYIYDYSSKTIKVEISSQ